MLLGLISPPLPPSLFRLMLPEEPPSAPPKNIVASGRTNQSIMVQWQPPPEPEHNGALRGYVLRQVPRPALTLVASSGSDLLRPQAQTSAGAQRSSRLRPAVGLPGVVETAANSENAHVWAASRGQALQIQP